MLRIRLLTPLRNVKAVRKQSENVHVGLREG